MQFPISNEAATLEAWSVSFVAFVTLVTLWVARFKVVSAFCLKVWRAFKFCFTFPFEMEKRMTAQDKKLESISKEFKTNGGGSIRDIVTSTNRLALESNRQAQYLIKTHPVAIYTCEPAHGKCVSANIALCELFGLDEAAMLGSGWIAGIVPEERQACFEAYHKAVESDFPYSWAYTVKNHRTGERIPCVTELTVMRDDAGKAILYQGQVTRVSDQSKPNQP